MNFENLKLGICPQCDKTFKEVDLEILANEDRTEKIVHHKPCGFKVMENMYKMALEQGKLEIEAMDQIEKLNLTPGLFRIFCTRYVTRNFSWKVTKMFDAQIVRNDKLGEDNYFLAIPFKGEPPKMPKGIKRPVNQGKRRGFTKPLRKKKSN